MSLKYKKRIFHTGYNLAWSFIYNLHILNIFTRNIPKPGYIHFWMECSTILYYFETYLTQLKYFCNSFLNKVSYNISILYFHNKANYLHPVLFQFIHLHVTAMSWEGRYKSVLPRCKPRKHFISTINPYFFQEV